MLRQPYRYKYKVSLIKLHKPARSQVSLLTEVRDLRAERQSFKSELHQLYPIEIAAKLSKKHIRSILKDLPHSHRIAGKRYFRRAKDVCAPNSLPSAAKRKGRKLRYSYEEYIRSPEWTSRKNAYYRRFGRFCEACNSSTRIHLHHMVYTAYNGTEPDKHLVALCETHHNAYHAKYGTKSSMLKTTKLFITEIKRSFNY